jgi:hypothetical protein
LGRTTETTVDAIPLCAITFQGCTHGGDNRDYTNIGKVNF